MQDKALKKYCQNCGNNSFYLTYIDIDDPQSLAWICEECEKILAVVKEDEAKEIEK